MSPDSTWASWDTLVNNMRQNMEVAVYHIPYCRLSVLVYDRIVANVVYHYLER